MLKKLRHYLTSGLLAIAPLFLTFLVLRYILKLADSIVVNPVFELLPIEIDATFKIILTKLAIAACVLLFIVMVGIVTEKFIARQFIRSGEAVLKSIPIINTVYGSIQEIAQAFFGDKRGVFRQVVFLEYPRKGIYSLGFVTQEKRWEIHEITGKDIVSVFIPSPPNPATGWFVFVPKEELILPDLTVEEGIRMVISGGTAVPALKKNVSH